MGQDYWKGGWATAGMQGLPGTQGAAAHKVEYNPLHALADILGAYWQKKGYEGAMKRAAGIGDELDQLTQPQQPQPQEQAVMVQAPETQLGEAVKSQAVSDMMQGGQTPNIDFLGVNQQGVQTPEAEAVKRGMAAAQMAENQGQLQNPMQEYAAQTVQAVQAQPQQVQPLSYNEYLGKAKALKATAMQEIIKKYGPQYAQMAEGMIDDAINQRVSAFGESVLSDKYNSLFGERKDLDTPNGRMAFLKDLGAYNILAKKIGSGEISPQFIKEYLDSNARKQSTVNLGNRVAVVESPANGGRFDDGSSVRVAGELGMGMSPSDVANLQFRQSEARRAQANSDRDYAFKMQQFQTNYNLALKKLEESAKKGGEGGGISSQQVSSAKAILDAYSDWEKNNRAMNPDAKNPYEQQANYATQFLNNAIGNTDQQQAQGQSQGTGDAVGDWINEAYKRGYTKEQIQAKLREKGYGDKYDSWLWD